MPISKYWTRPGDSLVYFCLGQVGTNAKSRNPTINILVVGRTREGRAVTIPQDISMISSSLNISKMNGAEVQE